MSVERVKDRKDEDINEGDHVWTRYRGSVREGDVHAHSPFFFFFLESQSLCREHMANTS